MQHIARCQRGLLLPGLNDGDWQHELQLSQLRLQSYQDDLAVVETDLAKEEATMASLLQGEQLFPLPQVQP